MKNKAFVCFLVDGPSDIGALRLQFEDLFDSVAGDDINVDFRFADFQGENRGDITTLTAVNPDNIEKSIYKYYFREQDKNSELGWDDLTCIIHIIDMDGAYSKNIRVFTGVEEKMADEMEVNGKIKNVLYFDDHIAVRDNIGCQGGGVSSIEVRNRRKRQNIEHLLTIDEIKIGKNVVKYELYYFATNLDHYLCGNANLMADQKIRNANDFRDKYINVEDFSKSFSNEFSTEYDYNSSRREIKKGNNSLLRGTNMNLLIDKITNSSLDDWL